MAGALHDGSLDSAMGKGNNEAMRRSFRGLIAGALVWATLNVCWMPVSMCAAPRQAQPSCHQTQDDAAPPSGSCCGGSHASLSQADVSQAPVLETSFFVVAVLSVAQPAADSVSWSISTSDLSPPPAPPAEPSLGRAPPVPA